MEDIPKAKRHAVLLLLHALLWAFAMIAAGALWEGHDLVPWMAVGFVIVNGLLIAAMGVKSNPEE